MKRSLRKMTLVFGLFITGHVASNAQKSVLDIGVRGGLSVPDLHGGTNEISKGYVSRFAPNAGITASWGLNKMLSVVLEADYSSQGGKRDGMQPIPAGRVNGISNTLYADFRTDAILDYIEIPLMVRITHGTKWKYYINAGPYLGLLLDAKTKTSGTGSLYFDKEGTQPVRLNAETLLPPQSFDETTNVRDDINPLNFGITGGLGLGHQFGRHGIWLDGRFALGLTNIQRDTQKNGENNTGALMFDIGYSFSILK